MRIIFAGSSEFAVPALRAIIADNSNQLLGVITQPDSKKGRGLQETISPVKAEALKQDVKVYQPASINDADFIKVLQGLKPEIMVVAAYGQKLSNAVLSLPPKGCINIHPSMLPKYRGAAPINYALWNGDNQTGVTIFRITGKMDAGPILSCCRTAIGADENAVELGNRLAELGAGLAVETLGRIRDNKIDLQEQSGPATCAPKLAKNDGKIIWTQAAQKIYWQYKAMQPWPGVFTVFGNKTVEITSCAICQPEGYCGMGGEVIATGKDSIIVAAGQGSLAISRLKPAGGRILTAQEFINGYRLEKGDRFA